jgi:hypothetical protein
MASDVRPGLNPRRLIRLMHAAIDRCELELTDCTVLTEAASGAYVVTPVLAAMAGADVYALGMGTVYASADEIETATMDLAALAGVADQVSLIDSKAPEFISAADIVTNSGQVRPIDRTMIAQMKSSSVVPLMYESWEYRASDVDLAACRARGITVAGTNERHPRVDVFSFLGLMAIKQLHDAGIEVRGSRIVLLCDNSFGSFITRELESANSQVVVADWLTADLLSPHCDAVLLATHPREGHAFSASDAELLRDKAPGAVLVQYWGDADYPALVTAGVPVWPKEAPRAGHMGVLPSALGPDPVIRLQAGGLKVGQILAHDIDKASPEDLALVQLL